MQSAPPLGEDLTARLGTPQKVRTLGSSPRSQVWRAEFGGTAAVIKHLVAGPDADDRGRAQRRHLAREAIVRAVGKLENGDGPLRETARLAARMREAMLGRWPGLRPLPTKRQ